MKILRNILAIILGFVIGGVVNFAIITLGYLVIPPPAGVDLTTPEGLAAAMNLFEPKHFIGAFLGHAIGTLVGAVVAYLIAASAKSIFAYVVGALFLLGGIYMALIIPAPLWFEALDVVVAYIPMAWLGVMIGRRFQPTVR